MTDTNLNPETLYQQYRQRRNRAWQSSAREFSSRCQPDSQSDTSLASLAYQRYKSTRLPSKDSPVDAIMSLIHVDHDFLNGDENTMHIVSPSEKYDTRSSEGNVVSFFRGSAMRMFDAGVKPFDRLKVRIFAPAVAASLLVLLVFPMILDMGQPRNTFTLEDVVHYRSAAAFIKPGKGQNLGFTSGAVDEKSAFNLGLLATQISVSALGGESSKLDVASQQLSMLMDAEAIAILNESLTEVRASMATLFSPSVSDPVRAKAANNTLNELSVFRSTLKSENTDNDGQLWFDLGEHIQAISLFAQLHSEHNMTHLLKNEMTEFLNAPFPDERLAVTKPLNELKRFSSKNIFNIDDTNEIISLCRHIKILML